MHDLCVVDPAQVHRGDGEVGMTELAAGNGLAPRGWVDYSSYTVAV
jgi:hypothetical protein